MIRKLLTFLGLVAVSGSLALAQYASPVSVTGPLNAISFAYGSTAGPAPLQVLSGSTGTGSYTITLAFGQAVTNDGIKYTAVSTSAPITIGGAGNIETVTPTAVSCSTPTVYATCTVTATFTYSHGTGDQVRSGDFGLEEAAAYALTEGGGLVATTPQFWAAAGVTTNSGVTTWLAGYKSLGLTVQVLNYLGLTGATSYGAASGSAYAAHSTAILY